MKKAMVLFMAICISALAGCATLPTHDGGKLTISEKTPTDGFFLPGNLAYVKSHLKVSVLADNAAPSVSNLMVEYANTGEDGIRLKVTCCWTDLLGNCFENEPSWKYEVNLLPYSKYLVRKRAVKPAQKWTKLACSHGETLDELWNSPLNIRP